MQTLSETIIFIKIKIPMKPKWVLIFFHNNDFNFNTIYQENHQKR